MLGQDYTVRIEKITKNNKVSYDAVVIFEKEKHISPSVYLDEYFKEYKEGKNIAELALAIIVSYEKYKDEMKFDTSELLEYERMKERLYVRVINAGMNEELLETMPHRIYNDFAMIVYAIIEDSENSRMTMNVTHGNIKLWNISAKQLFDEAIENTRSKQPHEIRKMSDVMKEILVAKVLRCGYKIGEDTRIDELLLQEFEAIEASERHEMYMLSNARNRDGAVYMLFDDVLENIADMVNNDIILIPSSIHEVLIVPMSDEADCDYLCDLVKFVNNKNLEPIEVLSDKVYVYERGKGIKKYT